MEVPSLGSYTIFTTGCIVFISHLIPSVTILREPISQLSADCHLWFPDLQPATSTINPVGMLASAMADDVSVTARSKEGVSQLSAPASTAQGLGVPVVRAAPGGPGGGGYAPLQLWAWDGASYARPEPQGASYAGPAVEGEAPPSAGARR